MILAFTAIPAYSQMESAPAPALATQASAKEQCCSGFLCRINEFFAALGKSGEERDKAIAECRTKCLAKQGEKAAS